MPRININEQDFTSPGNSLDYANYAVLIAGFEGKEPATTETKNKASGRLAKYRTEEVDGNLVEIYNRPVAPDEYGVYEFTSYSDFEETIGKCAPRHELAGGDKIMYHYGNQMAYELLKLGYTVIYKVITTAEELAEESTWEIFKDRSSYDFRFITHGLLNSDPTVKDFLSDSDVLAKDALIALADRTFTPYIANYKTLLSHIILGADNTVIEVPGLSDSQTKNEKVIRESKIHLSDILDTFDGFEGVTAQDLAEAINAGFSNLIETNENVKNYVVKTSVTTGTGKTKTVQTPSFEECWNSLAEYIVVQNAGLSACVTGELIANANTCIANLAAYKADEYNKPLATSGRGDCIALIELDENAYTKTSSSKPEQLIAAALSSSVIGSITAENSAYCALTVPSVFYKSLSTDTSNIWQGNNKMPGGFHYLACFINSLNLGYKEWYAAAGYTRGVSSLTVDHTSVKLGEIAINTLEPRCKSDKTDPPFACNVIANFRGSYYLWGNRTTYLLGDKSSRERGDLVASSFLNIRQLCTTIKKQLYTACRQFTFDPNSDTLWINFCETIRPTLDAMKADQGIRDYRIIKVPTNIKATLKAKIRIIPIEAVEDFDIEVSLEDSFGETTVTAN